MATGKIMHGARAQVILNGVTVGIFTNVSYGMEYDIQPALILGRFSPVELAYTAAEPIGISATGWRIVDQGPFTTSGGTMPKLQDLLTAEDLTFAIYDRQTDKLIMKVVGVRHRGFQSAVAIRALEDMTLNFVGLRLSDESADNMEAPGASDLP
jgi:hypothetical protein